MSLGPVFDAALASQEVCKEIGLKFCVIDGVALQRWGEPRFTADVDLSVVVEPGGEDTVARELLARLEARVIERSSLWAIDGNTGLRTCSAEDLLVMKCFAARDKDWADVTSILERLGSQLNLVRVREELQPLVAAKEGPEILGEWP